ncbi:MAG: hypothetical protein JNM99_07670 [Verrucomicrobiaceae bacterium]|nr:hypothetical protein [Verrucomicrobiaceae bacterium]
MINSTKPCSKQLTSGRVIAFAIIAGLSVVVGVFGFLLAGKSSLKAPTETHGVSRGTTRGEETVVEKANPKSATSATTNDSSNIAPERRAESPQTSPTIVRGGVDVPASDSRIKMVDSPVSTSATPSVPQGLQQQIGIQGLRKLQGSLLVYPGLDQSPPPVLPAKEGVTNGMVTGWTQDSVKAVADYYAAKFTESGFGVETRGAYEQGESKGATLIAKNAADKTAIEVSVSQEVEGKTHVIVHYEEPK